VIVDHPDGAQYGTEHGVVSIWNPAAATLFRIPSEQAIGQSLSALLDLPLPLSASADGSVCELAATRPDGTQVVLAVSSSQWPGDAGHQVCHIIRDITGQVARRELLERRAAHDPLTGLANRATFLDRLRTALTPLEGSSHPPAVLYLDLDRFKAINDEHGHAIGDELLRQVARRLLDQLRADDVAARLGGDEFAALIVGSAHRHDIGAIAVRCLTALNEPYQIDGVRCDTSTSIGIATAEPGDTADQLVHKADLAMYAAKRAGRARIHHHHILEARSTS
jgi:diguanylate cyclase (GGDEF)-like protein